KLVFFLCRDGVTYPKLRKIESRTKKLVFFLCRDEVTSPIYWQSKKNREQNEKNLYKKKS
ncbi:MAG: hypothetical protein IKR05_07295, partial [Prevotella sp.]|nr:hypothetical protein [Prevotella sp.]